MTTVSTTIPGADRLYGAGSVGPFAYALNASAWFRFTADANRAVVLNTRGSDGNTVLRLYETFDEAEDIVGVNELSLVKESDNISATDVDSEIKYLVLAGRTYYVQVRGLNFSQASAVYLNWSNLPIQAGSRVATVSRYQQTAWLGALAAAVDGAQALAGATPLGARQTAYMRRSGLWLVLDTALASLDPSLTAVGLYSGSTLLFTVPTTRATLAPGSLALKMGPT